MIYLLEMAARKDGESGEVVLLASCLHQQNILHQQQHCWQKREKWQSLHCCPFTLGRFLFQRLTLCHAFTAVIGKRNIGRHLLLWASCSLWVAQIAQVNLSWSELGSKEGSVFGWDVWRKALANDLCSSLAWNT